MNDSEIIKIIEETLLPKINENPNFIRYTYYEIRVKYNLSKEDSYRFLQLIKIKLQNIDYTVHFTGSRFVYNGIEKIVETNELMVAIKNK